MSEISFEMKPVTSSNISAVGYDEESKTLRVVFVKGYTYDYKKVPERVFEEMMNAESVGKYFHANVRSDFDYHKV